MRTACRKLTLDAIASPSTPLRDRELASGILSLPPWIASGLDGSQVANDTGETSSSAPKVTAESCFWTTKDQSRFGGGLNFYAYANNDPVNFVDRTGMEPTSASGSEFARDWNDSWNKALLGMFQSLLTNVMHPFGGDAPPSLETHLALGVIVPLEGGICGGRLTGYRIHGLDQVISNDGVGVSIEAISDALKNPLSALEQANGTTRFVGGNATVVLNGNGELVTAWATNSSGYRIKP